MNEKILFLNFKNETDVTTKILFLNFKNANG